MRGSLAALVLCVVCSAILGGSCADTLSYGEVILTGPSDCAPVLYGVGASAPAVPWAPDSYHPVVPSPGIMLSPIGVSLPAIAMLVTFLT